MSDASILSYNATVAAATRVINAARHSKSESKLCAVLVDGPPGTGKTSMEPLIAKATGLQHTFRIKLSHHEVPDVAGVPVPREDTRRTHFYASYDMLPPDDLTGGLLVVLDEIGDCNIAQQNLACQMVFERRIHNFEFPPDTYFFLTSNRVQDRSGAQRIVTKLGNRIAWYTVDPTSDELFDYGTRNGWNPVVLAFIKMHGMEKLNPNDNKPGAPTYFNSFDPSDSAQMAKPQFASSRSYEFTSNYCNYIDEYEPSLNPIHVMSDVAGILGTPVASRFSAFRKIATTMPDPELILTGKKVPFPTKQEVLWSLTLTLASRVKKDQVKHVYAYLDQGPHEYLALAARMMFDNKLAELTGPDFTNMLKSPKLKAMFAAV